MSRIIELPEVLANQIAAGEVIERPASVVKELVENAIDAGSSQIIIEIEESGLKKIQITDNGHGIAHDEVELALRRHATSKIKNQADLFRIRTLGFRGEALPSIASVSVLTLLTAVDGASHGTKLVARGGEVEEVIPATSPVGTKVCVEDLFFNTPARLKYMKSQQAELSHIIDIVNRLGLAHPEISFSLISDGKEMTRTAGTGQLRQAIAGIYGLASAKKMIAIENSDLDFEITGFVSLPELTRANRNYISLFINGRYIKNFLLNRAILDGYGSKLMVGRFPLAVIHIHIDPYLADVNVHPTKQEVRISKERELMALLSEAISNSLKEQALIPDALENLAKSTVRNRQKVEQTILPLKENTLYYEKTEVTRASQAEVADHQVELTEEGQDLTLFAKETLEQLTKPAKLHFAERKPVSYDQLDHPELDLASLDKAYDKLEREEASSFPELEFFGQMHGTYLFAQGRDGLYIIDQHAAQERVKYEEYRESIGNVDQSQQQLLVPYIFEFPADDALRLRERMPLLEEVGVFLAEYGANQFILREHPIWMAEEEIESGIYEMCDMLLLTKKVSIKKYRAELAIMMSCKRSIKANHRIDDHSARQLLYQLSQCDNPYNCPHGRPVLVHFTKSDMEKMFRRIQENHTSLRELGKY
ncbi:DNA mismatch repair endonuclease MutL [Streptococcus sp. FDAARGOS_256]|uniref:DNA mismatch repair endonuclease MutL n=1 Tax=Streptococcus sp. FDAARGOS_256 TaxID=1975706 RepID=UPI000BAE1B0E|nr:DNA mismatch repair endonuclease MutL [Streptococcus sp. FDAARGOS_256]PNK72065.1 DNA mismatch repair endonuclease MutL [Streptococcus sp. FDAARGOS_256]